MGKIQYTLAFLFVAIYAYSAKIERVEPAYWWTGMKNTELQIMVYGKDIGSSNININYPGVNLLKIVKAESPNYIFIYLDITSFAKPGTMKINLTQKKQKIIYEFQLKERTKFDGAAGFDASDVLYLLMPDRFANGNPGNDDLEEVKADRDNPNARHGGDFSGIQQHLDYFKDLGVTTIWFNPVLENKMPDGAYHGYAITDFYKIDPRFGTNEDYCKIIEESHSKGLKVVMDLIFNHCGIGHWWMKDLPFQDWVHQPKDFVRTTHYKWTLMDNHAPNSEKDILMNGWFSNQMPDLNQLNTHLAKYLLQNSIWWIEYSRIDGIRMDTYPYADYEFMANWCQQIENEYPNFNIVGEGWYPRTAGSAWWQTNSVLNSKGKTNLKTVMDFELSFVMQNAFDVNSNTREGSEAGLFKIYEVIAQDYMYANPENLLIFADNHDLPRFNKKEDKDLNKYKQSIAFLLTTRGIPQIYYGTEFCISNVNKEGKESNRNDFPGGWKEDLTNAFNSSGRTSIQNEAWNYMQTLLHWRMKTPAVTKGKLVHYTPGKEGVYVYARIIDKKTILVMLNGMDTDQSVEMKRFYEVIKDNTYGIDVITKSKINIETLVKIPAKGVYLLELN